MARILKKKKNYHVPAPDENWTEFETKDWFLADYLLPKVTSTKGRGETDPRVINERWGAAPRTPLSVVLGKIRRWYLVLVTKYIFADLNIW